MTDEAAGADGAAGADRPREVGGRADRARERSEPDVAAEARQRVADLFLDDRHIHGCAESAYIALKHAFGLPDPDDSSAAIALNGGVAYSGATCGAVTGAALALGLVAGQRLPDHLEAKRAARLLTAEVMRRFEDEFGAMTCRELSGADLTTEEGHQAFLDRGAWRVICMRQLSYVVERLAPLGDEAAWEAALTRLDRATWPPASDAARSRPR